MRRWLLISVALTLIAGCVSVYLAWLAPDLLPARLPVHWNVHGEVDGWVGRSWGLALMPLCMGGWVLLTLILPWLSPRQFEVESFRATYEYCMALVNLLLLYLHLVMTLGTALVPALSGRLVVGGIFLLIGLLGNVLGKVRRNFWIGIRTPWTLADEGVWNRTHRLGAWMFVLAGVGGFLAVLLGAPLLACFVLLMVAAFVPVVYSLVLYKRLEHQGKIGGAPS